MRRTRHRASEQQRAGGTAHRNRNTYALTQDTLAHLKALLFRSVWVMSQALHSAYAGNTSSGYRARQ